MNDDIIPVLDYQSGTGDIKRRDMNKQDYINLLFEKFQSCQIDRKQLEQCFEIVLKEVGDPVLALGNLQALLWKIFRGESATCLSEATQKQIRTILDIK